MWSIPSEGTWTALVWTRPTGETGSYSGPVQFTWAAEDYFPFGSLYPSKFDLAPGASQTLTADFRAVGSRAISVRRSASPSRES